MTKKRNNTEVNRPATNAIVPVSSLDYGRLVSEISDLLERARRTAARSVNSVLMATYWEIGRRIVEYEQGGKPRAGYGEELLESLSRDLTANHGRGFSRQGLQKMRAFYLGWEICPTPSGKFEARVKCPTLSGESENGKTQTPSAESESPLVLINWPFQAAWGAGQNQIFSICLRTSISM